MPWIKVNSEPPKPTTFEDLGYVEVVRCKDCVHWIPGTITDKDDFIQPRCKRNGGGWSADEYCSCAEKRTDEI